MTVQAIIEAAERLFAKHGIDGVSMRQISQEAGSGNHFSVQYHFGDKKALAEADWGGTTPCGPLSVDKILCGRDWQFYRIDTLEKSKKSEGVIKMAIEVLGLNN